MSLFSIKLKTKSGNDVKKKETFTVWFRVTYKVNALTKKKTAEYTYRIMYSGGILDPKVVFELKNSDSIQSIEDVTLKVLLNFCCILGKLSKDKNINPDFILFMSPDLEGKRNKAWMFLKDIFGKAKESEGQDLKEIFRDIKNYDTWDKNQCNRLGIKKDELDLLRDFIDKNPSTVFMNIDPNRNPKKYGKSIIVCNMLQERLDRKFEEDLEF